MQNKRISCRAIIVEQNKLIAMYREKNNRVYYTFPGGGQEENEKEEDCVIRECKEEFGIDIEVLKKVYIYENEKSIEHFFVCKWIGGEFGMGNGDEFSDNGNGVYMPVLIDMNHLSTKPLMPPEIASELIKDYTKDGLNFSEGLKNIKV